MFKSRADWLRWRKSGIGASDMPIILGLSKYKSVDQLYFDKISDDVDESKNYAASLGDEAEPKIRAAYELKVGKSFPAAVRQKNIFLASYDGLHESEEESIEIKLSGREDYEYVKQHQKPPPHYMPQVQQQLMVTPTIKVARFMCYPFKKFEAERVIDLAHLIVVDVEHDPDLQLEMLEKGSDFWFKNVQAKKPPMVKRTGVLGGVARASEIYLKLLDKQKEVADQIEHYKGLLIEEAEKTGKTDLIAGKLTMQKISRVGSVEYKKIPELQGVDLEKYRGPGTMYWKIAPKKEEK